jgi:transposase
MARSSKYPPELRERAVRMVFDHEREYPSQWKAISSISEQLGVHRESLRIWVRQAETDAGKRPGSTSEQLDEVKRLRRENAELRRANDILKAAASFFGAELDRHSKR